jgi:hypothetical protein
MFGISNIALAQNFVIPTQDFPTEFSSKMAAQNECGFKLANKLSRTFLRAKFKKLNKRDVFSDKFESAEFARNFKNYSRDTRLEILGNIGKYGFDGNVAFANNYKKLLNDLVNEKILTVKEINSSIKLDFSSTRFTVSADGQRFLIHLPEDPFTVGKINRFVSVSGMPKQSAKNYRDMLVNRKLNAEEIDILIANRSNLPHDITSIKKIDDYLDYITRYKPSEYKRALNNYLDIFDTASTNSYVKTYNKYLKKVEKIKDRRYNKLMKKFKKDNNGVLTTNLKRRARQEALEHTEIWKSLKKGCRSKNKSKLNYDLANSIAKRKSNFVKISTFIGVPLVTGAYVIAHRGDEKDGAYWGNLGYDVINTIIFGFVSGKINSGNLKLVPGDGLTAGSKMFQQWTINLWLPWITGGIYKHTLDQTDQEIEERFKALQENPDKKKKIDQLLKFLEEEKIAQKIFSDATDELDIEDLDIYNLDNENTEDFVYELLAREIYSEQQGQAIVTGDRVMDKVAFYRLMDPVGIPKSIAISLGALFVLCRSKNPRAGLAAAMALLAIDRIGLEQPILYQRDKMINM